MPALKRPFFSLAIILEMIAASLLLISSAYGQTGVPTLDATSGAAHGCGWLWHGDSGRDMRKNCVQLLESIQHRCYVLRSAPARDSLPWTAADEHFVNAPTLISTGYDVDYDFAMFEGRYHDVALSRTDIEGSMADRDVKPEPSPEFVISCPASSPYYDDYACCLDAGFNRWINEDRHVNRIARESFQAWGVCEADGFVEPSVSIDSELDMCQAELACHYVEVAMKQTFDSLVSLWHSSSAPFAQPQEPVLSKSAAKDALAQVKLAAIHSVELIRVSLDCSWRPFSYHRLVIETQKLTIADLIPQRAVFPVATTISLTEGQQIAALTQAATALDQMGIFLQQAAQELRYIAADRIVSKGSFRRIAREGNR